MSGEPPDTLAELRRRGHGLLDRWAHLAADPAYLTDWAKSLARAVAKGELQRLHDDYASRGRDRRLAKRDRVENRKRAAALRKYAVK